MTRTAKVRIAAAEARAAGMAAALILLLPLASLLRFHAYPLWRTEVVISAAILAATGLIAAFVASGRGARLRPAVMALLLLLCADLQFGLDELAPTWGGDSRFAGAAIIVEVSLVLIGLTWLAWLLRQHLGTVLATAFAVGVIATIILPARQVPAGVVRSQSGVSAADLPPVVHLVLDAHIGPAGLPTDLPGGAELRRDLEAFYRGWDFELHPRAFSRYSATQHSLPNMLNGTAEPRMGAFLSVNGTHRRVTENAWFEDLAARGYRIRVYQSDYLDFCGGNADYCYVYPADGIGVLAGSDLGLGPRVRTILRRYASRSLSFRVTTALYRALVRPAFAKIGVSIPDGLRNQPSLAPMGALETFERLRTDMNQGMRGTAYFAHLIIPHGAYMLDRDCRLKLDPATWLSYFDSNLPSAHINNSVGRTMRYQAYFQQVRCTMKLLDELLRDMNAKDALTDATIIVHGDHGSLISLVWPNTANAQYVTARDLIDTYSTLFALRRPGVRGQPNRPRPVQDLFGELLLGRAPNADDAAVFLLPQRWEEGEEMLPLAMPPMGE